MALDMMSREEAVKRTKRGIEIDRAKKAVFTPIWLETDVNKAIKTACGSGLFSVALKVPNNVDAYLATDLLNEHGFTAYFYEKDKNTISVSWRCED